MTNTTTNPTPDVPAVPASPLLAQLSAQWDRTVPAADPANVPSDPDACVGLLMALEAVKRTLSDLSRACEAARQEFGKAVVERHGSDAVFPYYVGREHDHRPRQPARLWEALLAKAEGDESAALGCLSSSAFKPGACRALLGDDGFAEHFETVTVGKLTESKGKAADAAKLLKRNTFGV